MQNFLQKLDKLAGIETENKWTKWLERLVFFFLTLMVLFAPHTIAATESAWLLGMTFWAIRIFVQPRPRFVKMPLNIALAAFIGWTVLTCVFSYAPDISIDRLRSVSVVFTFFFLVHNLRTKRAAIFLAFALIFSCMVNVVWTSVERIVGRGVEIENVKPDSPLAKVGLINGDALLKADGKKIYSPEGLEAEIERNETTDIYFYRPDFYFTVTVHKSDLLGGSSALEKLGIGNWKHSRNWRSQGFFRHWATYSEILQLLASLTFGILIALFLARKRIVSQKSEVGNRSKKDSQSDYQLPITNYQLSITNYQLLFAVCLGGMLFALLLTTTRASQIGFILSAFAIVWLTGKRKWLLALAAVVLPLAIVGFVYLEQARNVGVVDADDGSTQYRMMMYRDGFRLWAESGRNVLLGVGMDSIKRYWREWHLFDNGWQPMGHFHSTMLQLLVERGLPALLLWLWVLWLYARMLWRKFQIPNLENDNHNLYDWRSNGILLGCFGGLIGFFSSSLVQNNLGDTQVATVFYILMGLSVYLIVNGSLMVNGKW
ncbi:MAG: O-antigen ligase family protein [Pyrinomonadaceae bacterium]